MDEDGRVGCCSCDEGNLMSQAVGSYVLTDCLKRGGWGWIGIL